jgi:DNA-directed RNA polymerase subunit RPC12/RpoP
MTRQQKIKLLDKIDKDNAEFNALKHYVFYCNTCNFKVEVTDRPNTYISCQVGNYYELEMNRNENRKYVIEYKRNINGIYWSSSANSICLNCGNTVKKENKDDKIYCDKCGSENIAFWKDLPDKKCPDCNGKFDVGIFFNSNYELIEWNIDEWNEEISKAKNKYGVKEKNTNKELTEEEKRNIEKKTILFEHFMDERYVLNNNHNIIKFVCNRSFHSPFTIIAEWFNEIEDGKIIFCMYYCGENEKSYISKNLENSKIKELLSVLDKYKYFTKPNKSNRMGFDGSTWTLEVQIGKSYKEIDVWSPNKGGVYDIGNLLINYSGAIINELY